MQDSNKNGDDILYQTQHGIFMRLLPLIVCGAILGAVGIIGNILAMIFYTRKSKRTTTVNLIISLSIVDFIVCLLVIPNLAEVILNVRNSQRLLCKVTNFLSLWTILSSCILLWVISIDRHRHRRICKPFAKQIKIYAVKYIVAGIVIFSFALAIRNLIIVDTVALEISTSSNNRTTIGYYCTITDDPDLKIIVSSFHPLDFFLILVAWVTIIVTYSNAIFILMKQRHKMKREPPKVQHNIQRRQSITETSCGTRYADGGNDWNISEDLNVSRGMDKESSYRDDNDKTQKSKEGSHRLPMLTLNPMAVFSACNLSKRNANDIIKSDVTLVGVKSVNGSLPL